MKLIQTKTQRELEAVREIEKNLEHREKRQRIIGFIAAGVALMAVVGCLARMFRSDDWPDILALSQPLCQSFRQSWL